MLIRVILISIGSGQVRYNHPDIEWMSFETENYRIHYYDQTESSARLGAEVAETIFSPVTSLYNYEPDKKTIDASIKAGLHSFGCAKTPQPRVLLPYNSPPESLANGKVSGPLWIGPLARKDVLEQLTEEYALEICGISKAKDEYVISLAGWKDEDLEKST